jgi:hypothetical protein
VSAAQEQETVTISANDPRPLATVIRGLESRYGWAITYEDPPYLHQNDIADVTRAVSRDFDPKKPKILGPRANPFDFGFRAPSGGARPDVRPVLEKLVDDYHLTGNPGRFGIVQTGAMFHIVPVATRDATGRQVASRSLLDAKIAVPTGQRSALEVIDVVARAVGNLHGISIGVGMVPVNLLNQVRLDESAISDDARTVLVRTLAAAPMPLSWQIFCEPAPSRLCALNIHSVRK